MNNVIFCSRNEVYFTFIDDPFLTQVEISSKSQILIFLIEFIGIESRIIKEVRIEGYKVVI